MKFIPDAIGRKIGSGTLLASEHAPKALFVGGVVGMVGSTVLACRATLQVGDVLDRIEAEKRQHDQAKAQVESPNYEGTQTYPDNEYRRDIAIISAKGAGKVARLYAPAVVLGGVSIFALTKSHNLLQNRNIALTAAYTAVDSAFKNYRERVVDRFGEEVDQELQFESEQVDIVDEETGEVTSTVRACDLAGSAYARFYDQESSRNWSEDPRINLIFLKGVQNSMNDKLRLRGHVFLNEVFTELGMTHTTAGAIVGWRYRKGSGDDYIDFGFWDSERDVVLEFFNGREGSILLDFNVDGVMHDKIDQGPVPQ